MNIVMMTNSYKPVIGGLENSVEVFSRELKKLGHNVLIVCPRIKGALKEKGVFRLPALQNFNKSEFAIELPITSGLLKRLNDFKPDIVHSHHPFLIGDTALRASAVFNIPVIFTHHSLYEKNMHYVPGNSRVLRQFIMRLSVGYANMCARVIAPSGSVAQILRRRGVHVPIDVVPTGIYPSRCERPDPSALKEHFGIPARAFTVGTASRMALEKNIPFLMKAIARFLEQKKDSYYILVGAGPLLASIKAYFRDKKLDGRLVSTGPLKGKQLSCAYAAMDIFAFASHSETQGLVLSEAMAQGVPVIAVDAPGVRDTVKDKINGRLIPKDNIAEFTRAISWFKRLGTKQRVAFSKAALETASGFSASERARELNSIYEAAIKSKKTASGLKGGVLDKAMRFFKAQKDLLVNVTRSAGLALLRGGLK